MSVANEISEPLSHIINLTFISGIIPDHLKEIALKKNVYYTI